jgi:LacI family transcriptional regulator
MQMTGIFLLLPLLLYCCPSFNETTSFMKIKRLTSSASDPITLNMVAHKAGVSPSTVSRILNGTAIVSNEKQKAVGDAISELGFVPNPVARGLAGGRTLSIGVVTQAIDSPFYSPALRGIEDALGAVGYSALFVSAQWNAANEARCIHTLRSRRVDGLIVLSGRLSNKAMKEVATQVPTVVTGRSIQGPRLFALNFDNFAGGQIATQHLIDLGHKRIVFITGDSAHADANERFRGYRAALQLAALTFDPQLVLAGNYQEISGLDAVNQLIAQGVSFSAIFAANDQMAFGAALALHQHGIRVPEDVSLVGFDDLAHSMYTTPPLSTIHQPAYELGSMAASALLSMLAGGKPAAMMTPPSFVVRHSTAPARA